MFLLKFPLYIDSKEQFISIIWQNAQVFVAFHLNCVLSKTRNETNKDLQRPTTIHNNLLWSKKNPQHSTWSPATQNNPKMPSAIFNDSQQLKEKTYYVPEKPKKNSKPTAFMLYVFFLAFFIVVAHNFEHYALVTIFFFNDHNTFQILNFCIREVEFSSSI